MFLAGASITITYVRLISLRMQFSQLFTQTETKESKWDMPDELLLLLEKVEKDKPAQPRCAFLHQRIIRMFVTDHIQVQSTRKLSYQPMVHSQLVAQCRLLVVTQTEFRR